MSVRQSTVPDDVLAILSGAEVDDTTVRLTCGQLDRRMYLAVNDVLSQMGGRWDRRAKGHVFDSDPADILEDVLLTGTVARKRDAAKDAGFFPSPPAVIERLLLLAGIEPGMSVLEPSAGHGAIADRIRGLGVEPDVIELLPENQVALRAKGYNLVGEDFLVFPALPRYDRIIMNPPFARQSDIDHVRHAFDCLHPGGRLVSVMGAGVTFRQDHKAVGFRAFVEDHGALESLPERSFRESGTDVNTVIVLLDRGESGGGAR